MARIWPVGAHLVSQAIERQIAGSEGVMIRPTAVEPREGHRIWVRYSDGASGEVDLSHLAGRGVFEAWDRRACFESVRITSGGAIAWDEAIELCPDAIYMRLTGKPVEEVMPRVRNLLADA